MGIKFGTTNMTVVKWGTTSLTTVNYGSTKVFPDNTYEQLQVAISGDSQEGCFRLVIDNPDNGFDVNVTCDLYGETSTGSDTDTQTISVDAFDGNSLSFGDSPAQNIYYASADLTISGGGYTWSQFEDEDFR